MPLPFLHFYKSYASTPSQTNCPCVVGFRAEKKKPAKAQIPDFFSASKDNLQIHKKSRGSKFVTSLITLSLRYKVLGRAFPNKAIAKFINFCENAMPLRFSDKPQTWELLEAIAIANSENSSCAKIQPLQTNKTNIKKTNYDSNSRYRRSSIYSQRYQW